MLRVDNFKIEGGKITFKISQNTLDSSEYKIFASFDGVEAVNATYTK